MAVAAASLSPDHNALPDAHRPAGNFVDLGVYMTHGAASFETAGDRWCARATTTRPCATPS